MHLKLLRFSTRTPAHAPPLFKNTSIKSRKTSLGREAARKSFLKSCVVSSMMTGINLENRHLSRPYSRSTGSSIAYGLGSDSSSQSIALEERVQQASITRVCSYGMPDCWNCHPVVIYSALWLLLFPFAKHYLDFPTYISICGSSAVCAHPVPAESLACLCNNLLNDVLDFYLICLTLNVSW